MSKKKKQKTTQEPIITPNKWQSQHHEYEISNARSKRRLYRVTNQTPLDYLYKRKSIDDSQYQAGNEIFKFFQIANIQKLKAVDYSRNKNYGTTKNDLTSSQIHARKKLKEAIQTLGRIGSKIALDVCCYENTVKDVSIKISKNEKYVMERLREALDDYAIFMGIK